MPKCIMVLTVIVVVLFFLVSLVSSTEYSTQAVKLQNPGFESPPTNLTTNSTSQPVLLDTKANVIPGWSFNGTVWYVTAGGNISLPGNGHGLQLGPNGMINQTFKSDGSYDYVITFTLAPSSMSCANNLTAVNVSGPSRSQVFFFKESLGNQLWQTYGYSIGNDEIRSGIMGIQIQSVVNNSRGNMTCWPIVDTFLVNGIQNPRMYSVLVKPGMYESNGFVNSGFEVGPSFIDNSSQGVLLEADSDNDPFHWVQSPLQDWTILGTVKYIDSKHYAVPRGRGAVELLSGDPSGIEANVYFLKHGQVKLDFIMGDANDSCVGDLMVFLQVGNTVWNFTMRSIGVGSREQHSVTFKAEFSSKESVPITFYSFNETRTTNSQVLCGPVIDSTVLWFSSGLSLESTQVYNGFMIFSFVLATIIINF